MFLNKFIYGYVLYIYHFDPVCPFGVRSMDHVVRVIEVIWRLQYHLHIYVCHQLVGTSCARGVRGCKTEKNKNFIYHRNTSQNESANIGCNYLEIKLFSRSTFSFKRYIKVQEVPNGPSGSYLSKWYLKVQCVSKGPRFTYMSNIYPRGPRGT